MTWQDSANCRHGLVDMFPDPGDADAVAAALALCVGCPVGLRCAHERKDADSPWGVWNGVLHTTSHETWQTVVNPPETTEEEAAAESDDDESPLPPLTCYWEEAPR